MIKKGDLVIHYMDYFARKSQGRTPRIFKVVHIENIKGNKGLRRVIIRYEGKPPEDNVVLEGHDDFVRVATKTEISLYYKKPIDNK